MNFHKTTLFKMSLNEINPEEIQRIYKGFSRNAETFNLIVERKNGKKKIVIRFCNKALRDLAFEKLNEKITCLDGSEEKTE